MTIDYLQAKLGQHCPNRGSTVHVASAEKFLKGDLKARIIVKCDCYIGCYRLTKIERALLPALLGIGHA